MADKRVISELTTLVTVDQNADWLPVVDVSDTSASTYGTTKKALVAQFIGPTGAAATVDAGSTTTSNPGTDASVVNSGSTSAAVFDFTIPRGAVGAQGAQGIRGIQGDAATANAGTTTTGNAGTNASVVNSGSTAAAVFDFTIPRGNTGATGAKGDKGDTGAGGDNAYCYIAYASDASGTGFTLTFNAALNYIAIKSTDTIIASPVASDFTGLWKNYKGATGETGSTGSAGADGDDAFVYIAYASDASGTDFTNTFDAALNYIAIKNTTTAIVSPVVSDFTGLWKNYKGVQGIQGIQGVTGNNGTNGTNGTNGVDGEDAYVYIAYASDASGTDFTNTFDALLNYIAVKTTTTPIASPVASDFTGLWKNYKGATGATGPAGAGSGDVLGPATNTDGYIAQWDGANSKTLKNGLAVPTGGLAGITALNTKASNSFAIAMSVAL